MGNLFPQTIKYSGSILTRPNAADLPQGSIVYFDDFPQHFGSYWRALSIFGKYSPISGGAIVGGILTPTITDGTATEQVLASTLFPADLTADIGAIIADIFLNHTDGGTCDIRIRCGPAGDITDTLLHTHSMSGPANNAWIIPTLRIISNTELAVFDGQPVGNSTVDQPTVVVVPDMDAAQFYISVTAQVGQVGHVATLSKYSLKYSAV